MTIIGQSQMQLLHLEKSSRRRDYIPKYIILVWIFAPAILLISLIH